MAAGLLCFGLLVCWFMADEEDQKKKRRGRLAGSHVHGVWAVSESRLGMRMGQSKRKRRGGKEEKEERKEGVWASGPSEKKKRERERGKREVEYERPVLGQPSKARKKGEKKGHLGLGASSWPDREGSKGLGRPEEEGRQRGKRRRWNPVWASRGWAKHNVGRGRREGVSSGLGPAGPVQLQFFFLSCMLQSDPTPTLV